MLVHERKRVELWKASALIICPVCRLDLNVTMQVCPDCGTKNAAFEKDQNSSTDPLKEVPTNQQTRALSSKSVEKVSASVEQLISDPKEAGSKAPRQSRSFGNIQQRFEILTPPTIEKPGVAVDLNSGERCQVRQFAPPIFKTQLEFQRAADWLAKASQRRVRGLIGPPLQVILDAGVVEGQALAFEELTSSTTFKAWVPKMLDDAASEATSSSMDEALELIHKAVTEMARLTEWLCRTQTLTQSRSSQWRIDEADQLFFTGALESRCLSEDLGDQERSQILKLDLVKLMERLNFAITEIKQRTIAPAWTSRVEECFDSPQPTIMKLLEALTRAKPKTPIIGEGDGEPEVYSSAMAVAKRSTDDIATAATIGAPRVSVQRYMEPLSVFPESLRDQRRQEAIDRIKAREAQFREQHQDELELLRLDLGIIIGGGLGVLSLGLSGVFAPLFLLASIVIAAVACGHGARKLDQFLPVFGVLCFVIAASFVGRSIGILPIGILLAFIVHWRIDTAIESTRIDKKRLERGEFGLITRRRQDNEAALAEFRIFATGAVLLALSVLPIALAGFPMAKLTAALSIGALINYHLWNWLSPLKSQLADDQTDADLTQLKLPDSIAWTMTLGNAGLGLAFALLAWDEPVAALFGALLSVIGAVVYGQLVETILAPAAIDMYNPVTLERLAPEASDPEINVLARPRTGRFNSDRISPDPVVQTESPISKKMPDQRQRS